MKRIKLKLFVRKRPSSVAPTPPTASPATTPPKAVEEKSKTSTTKEEWGLSSDVERRPGQSSWRERLMRPHPPRRLPRDYEDDVWTPDPEPQEEGWARTTTFIEQWGQEAQDNIEKFIKHYASMGIDGIKAEFKKEVEGYVSPTYADTAFRANPTKNANNDVVTCLDDSRVQLADKTYINASWACDPNSRDSTESKPARYILAQMPNEATYEDFWQMVYEHRACLVMLVAMTDDKRVCSNFWPSKQDWNYYGKMAVLNDAFHRETWMDNEVTELEVTKKDRFRIQETGGVHIGEAAKVHEKNITGTLVDQIAMVDRYHVNREGPIVVVDGDGGRGLAAVLVLADMVGTRLIDRPGAKLVPALAQWLRRCRHGAIPTANEYLLAIKIIFYRIHKIELKGSEREFLTIEEFDPSTGNRENKEVPNKWFNKLRYEKEYRALFGDIDTPKFPTQAEKLKKELEEELEKEKRLREELAAPKEKPGAAKEPVGTSKEPVKPSKEAIKTSKDPVVATKPAVPSKEVVVPPKGKDAGSKEKAADKKKK